MIIQFYLHLTRCGLIFITSALMQLYKRNFSCFADNSHKHFTHYEISYQCAYFSSNVRQIYIKNHILNEPDVTASAFVEQIKSER